MTVDLGFKLPSEWYTQAKYFEAEQDALFEDAWYLVGPADRIERGGYWVPDHLPYPVVITRTNDDKLHAFHNVCLHHKAEVTHGGGITSKFTCPYHGWTYGLDGELKGTYPMKVVDRPPCLVNKYKPGLEKLEMRQEGPLLFVSLWGVKTLPLGTGYADVDFNWNKLHWVGDRYWNIPCNWKIYIENYLDGGYHVPILHKDLTKQLRLETYKIDPQYKHVIQTVVGASGDFQDRIGTEALYVWLYPNILINRYGPWLTTVNVLPTDAENTEIKVDYYLDPDYESDGPIDIFIRDSLAASSVVTCEDIDICQSVQNGMNSPASFDGIYVPEREAGIYSFHEQLLKDVYVPEELADY